MNMLKCKGLILIFILLLCGIVITVSPCYAAESSDNSGFVFLKTRKSHDYSKYSGSRCDWHIQKQPGHAKTKGGIPANFDFKKYKAWYLGPTRKKVIYLTFDCGYENGYTRHILNVLKKHKAKAIFFVTGGYIEHNPGLVKQMKEQGNLVGNHTYHHVNLATCSDAKMESEVNSCADLMKQKTGYDMDMYLRPPEGAYSKRSLAIARDMGYSTMFWSMAMYDWDINNQQGKEYVIQYFNQYCHPGAMPLMHIVSSSDAEALDTVLTNLEKAGYRFGSVDEFAGNGS